LRFWWSCSCCSCSRYHCRCCCNCHCPVKFQNSQFFFVVFDGRADTSVALKDAIFLPCFGFILTLLVDLSTYYHCHRLLDPFSMILTFLMMKLSPSRLACLMSCPSCWDSSYHRNRSF
jgi:hypothetical protein